MRKDFGAAIKGKDIDQKKMVEDGGTNARKNLRVRSGHANRGWHPKRQPASENIPELRPPATPPP